jgi:hypothetical protein
LWNAKKIDFFEVEKLIFVKKSNEKRLFKKKTQNAKKVVWILNTPQKVPQIQSTVDPLYKTHPI